MMLLAVVVVLIPYICPISLVTGVETTATPWESTADEAAVRIVGGEITSIKNYPFIVCVRRAHLSHAHRPLNLSPLKGIGTVRHPRIYVQHDDSDVKDVEVTRSVLCKNGGGFLSSQSWHNARYLTWFNVNRENDLFILKSFSQNRILISHAARNKTTWHFEINFWLTYLAVYSSSIYSRVGPNSGQRYQFY